MAFNGGVGSFFQHHHHHLSHHPAHPTPPPYTQPPPPTPPVTTVGNSVAAASSSEMKAPEGRSAADGNSSGEDLLGLSQSELVRRLQATRAELKRLTSATTTTASDSGGKPSENGGKMLELQTELRRAKELINRLTAENQELRDLCCFLDDDRQKGRKLAREWQRFGRYTASVMRQEVANYQSKLKELDGKQQELIRDNLELKVRKLPNMQIPTWDTTVAF
jgi:CCDC85 family